jgi:hypothetical protein
MYIVYDCRLGKTPRFFTVFNVFENFEKRSKLRLFYSFLIFICFSYTFFASSKINLGPFFLSMHQLADEMCINCLFFFQIILLINSVYNQNKRFIAKTLTF